MKKIFLRLLLFVCLFINGVFVLANEQQIINENGFYIVNGVLLKYTGDINAITEIVLPDEVKVIGTEAFSVENFMLSDNNVELSPKLRNKFIKLTIPADVKVQKNAFFRCFSMEIFYESDIKIMDKTYRIDPAENFSCIVHLPKNVTVLDEYALGNGSGSPLKNVFVFLNDNLKTINTRGLSGTIVVNGLPKKLKRIKDYGCFRTRFITRKTFDDYVEKCSSDSFTEVDLINNSFNVVFPKIPKNVEYIGSYAFVPHRDLLGTKKEFTVNIPAAVKCIELEIFGEKEFIQNDKCVFRFKVNKRNKNYSSDKFGGLYSKDKKVLYYTVIDKKKNYIPDTVEKIEFRALWHKRENYSDYHQYIYFPKKLKYLNRYLGGQRNTTYIFRGNSAPQYFYTKNNYIVKGDKLYKDFIMQKADEYMIVPAAKKAEYFKNLKIKKKLRKNVNKKI